MNRKIIIVEDDAAISDIIRIILTKNGYVVEEYLEGKSVIEYTRSWPDLFLLDKQLTDMDGLDICRHIKQQAETKDIPVIILSATPDLDQLAKEAGADAYIEKPFTAGHLLNTISNCIQEAMAKNYKAHQR
jgi:DNA-binding response OmpR family regulator